MAQRFDAIIFDIGGVLTGSPVEHLRDYSTKVLGLAPEKLGVALSSSKAFHQLERGEITPDAFAAQVERELRGLGGRVRVCGAEVLRLLTAVDVHRDLLAVIKHLRKKLRGSVKFGVITNNFASRGASAFRAEYEPLFDAYVESYEVRLRKPDAGIFRHAAHLLDVDLKRCIFVDDLGANLKAARALGMHTLRVVRNDTRTLILELAKLFAQNEQTLLRLHPPGINKRGVPKRHALPVAALLSYLKKELPHLFSANDTFDAVEMFGGGKSNPTYYLKVKGGGREIVIRKQPPGDLLKGAHSMEREYNLMRALYHYTEVPVPHPYLLCRDTSVIGTEFYVMEYVYGHIWAKGADCVKERGQWHFHDCYSSMVDTMAALHKLPYERLGLAPRVKQNPSSSANSCYFARTIRTWARQYEGGVSQGAPRMPDFEALHAQLGTRLEQVGFDRATQCIVHGDYKFDNIVFHPRLPKVIALLDLELSTVGHPYADLGYILMFHRMPAALKGMGGGGLFDEARLVSRYFAASGAQPVAQRDIEFLVAFSEYKLSSIVHGVWSRGLRGTAANVDREEVDSVGDMSKTLAKMGLECLRNSAAQEGAKL